MEKRFARRSGFQVAGFLLVGIFIRPDNRQGGLWVEPGRSPRTRAIWQRMVPNKFASPELTPYARSGWLIIARRCG
jgi:hypothetical protein